MADDFEITFPADGDKVNLVKGTNQTGLFFAISGLAADAKHRPDAALLIGGDKVVARGHVFREPGKRPDPKDPDKKVWDPVWAMWFNVEDVDLDGQFAIRVVRFETATEPPKKLGTVGEITLVAHPFVGVSYPSGGTVAKGNILCYGGFTPNDTAIQRVELREGAQVRAMNTSPYFNNLGFWSANLNVMTAYKNVVVYSIGNFSTGTSDPFDIV